MQSLVALLVCCVGVSSALSLRGGPDWDDLKVTWGVPPLSNWTFDRMPRNLNEDIHDGFQFKDDLCDGGKFAGKRYWKDEDPAVMLLFDSDGYIAGIQTSILKSKFTPAAPQVGVTVHEDGPYWTLTAYFVDPSGICNAKGRDHKQFENEGTGTGLYLKIGPGVLDNEEIPMQEDDAKQSKWTEGGCVYTMGKHFSYNVTKAMPCANIRPFFLTYNKGKLNSFGFLINAVLDSKRYEHSSREVFKKFIQPVPQCLLTDESYANLSSMHVFFTSRPRLNMC